MKKLLLLFLIASLAKASFAQNRVLSIDQRTKAPSFVELPNGKFSAAQSKEALQQVLNLRAEDSFELLRESTDELGMGHMRYQQYYKGLKVAHSQYIVHTKDGQVMRMNGGFEPIYDLDIRPSLNLEGAFLAALAFVNADKYAWETPEGAAEYKETMGHAPGHGELLIVGDWRNANGLGGQAPRLAYMFTVQAEDPFSLDEIYVDAQNGKILLRNALVKHTHVIEEADHHVNAMAPAQENETLALAPLASTTVNTRYSGYKPINTSVYSYDFGLIIDDPVPSEYYLYDASRSPVIHTRNASGSTSWTWSDHSEFRDDNNQWYGTGIGSAYLTGALDAHYAAGLTLDYYKTEHNRTGINGSMVIRQIVNAGSNWQNAQWNPSTNSMRYGMGTDGNSPLSTVDIVAHEMTHGVTTYTSNLVYAGESGALNEGLSDCFAAAVESKYAPTKQTWHIAEEVYNGPFRRMDNPKAEEDPDTYGGTNWSSAGVVHVNSGVLNHFFYLLSEGGTGINDNLYSYGVSGIGIAKAELILYRMNTVYLTANSGYPNARTAAISAATDLYGAGSNEVLQTTNAWYAVGVGLGTGACNNLSSPVSIYPYTLGFEGTLDDWTQDTGDNLDWTIDSNGTSSSGTGPSNATEGTRYLYVEASGANHPSKVANLISPCILVDPIWYGETEVTFDYHMYGSAMGTLRLQVSRNSGITWSTLWTKTGNQGNSWKTAVVSLRNYEDETIQLRFQGITGSSYTSDIAIDNFAINVEDADFGPPPSNLSAYAPNDVQVNLSWIDNTEDEEHFRIERRTGFSGQFVEIGITNANATSYIDNTIDVGSYYTYRVRASDGGQYTSYSNEVALFTPEIAPSEEPAVVVEKQPLVVFPNPATATLNVWHLDRKGAQLSIVDPAGRVVYAKVAQEEDVTLDISGLTTGMYVLRIVNGGEVTTTKFVKQ